MVYPLHRRSGGGAARPACPDAAAWRAHDAGHHRLRSERFLQPAGHRDARPAVLRDVPGGPAVAALAGRRDRGRRVLRPVLDADVALLVSPEPGGRSAVPAAGAGGRGAVDAPAWLAPGSGARAGRRRGAADRPGDGRAGPDPGLRRPAAMAAAPPPGRGEAVARGSSQAAARRAGRGRRRGSCQPADHRRDPAGEIRRRLLPGARPHLLIPREQRHFSPDVRALPAGDGLRAARPPRR